MERETYAVEAAVEPDHWWFVGRRELFARLILALDIFRDRPILDVGTSTGTNLRMLKELGFTRVSGLDASLEAIRYCSDKGLGVVERGDICDMPFADASFELILATDIIEHVDTDRAALVEIRRVLVPGGRALITVPAFQSLWGAQDELAHHKRRYRRQQLLQVISAAGLEVEDAFYFNYLLFLPIWLARQAIKLAQLELRSENELNTPWLNRLLINIFRFDVRTAPIVCPPFGVSILAMTKRPM